MTDTQPREVDLGGGRTLVVREAVAADVPSLEALYERLSDADRRLRFFSLYHPPREHFLEMVRAGERGGCALVAEVRYADGRAEIVGDAWFAAPRGAEGELAIVVDQAWRGWLGTYLLDALVEEAAARGVRDLLAIVLPENRSMVRLMRARPNVTLDDGDRSTLCLAIGASDRTPGWPEPRTGRRRRVLVEAAGGRWPAAAAARRAGLDVRVCAGPPDGKPERCPALQGEPCPLAVGADVVVVAPHRSVAEQRDLLDAHAALHADVPVVVQVPSRDPVDPLFSAQVVPAALPERDLVHLVRELAEWHAAPSEAGTSGEEAS
jgi:GNAT superfamily N-acetyltransferase